MFVYLITKQWNQIKKKKDNVYYTVDSVLDKVSRKITK